MRSQSVRRRAKPNDTHMSSLLQLAMESKLCARDTSWHLLQQWRNDTKPTVEPKRASAVAP